MEFASEADKSDYISLRGLIKNNQGLWKSAKQAAFQMKRARDDREFMHDTFGIVVRDTEKVLLVNALYKWTTARRSSRDLVPSLIAFVIDDEGVSAQYRIGGNGNLKQGWKPDPTKSKQLWIRSVDVQPSIVATTKEKKLSDLYRTYGYTQFTYHGDMRRFTAEASTLDCPPGDPEYTFYLQGKTQKLLFSMKDESEEGILFVVSKTYARKNPEVADVTVFIFNT